MPLLANKRPAKIILGVSGGIAAYKACELVRILKKNEHDVRVVLTKNAENFVGNLTFATLSGNPVLRSLSTNEYDLSSTSHIDLAQWGDIFVIAPATANTLAKIAHGIADDALTTEALAFTGSMLIAPAMNTRMWEAKITQENCAKLRERGIHFVGPIAGDLACGEVGIGKMSEPQEIASSIEQIWEGQTKNIAPRLQGKKVLITSGPTRSYIDSVRFLTNRSSGRMGHAVAMEAISLGAEVVLVSGPVEEKYSTIPKGKVLRVETNEEMLAAASSEIETADIIFGIAAVADFEVLHAHPNKLERKQNLNLELKPTTDILARLADKNNGKQVYIGFAAQDGDQKEAIDKARDKLKRKKINCIVFNNIARKDIGFDSNSNEAIVIARDFEEFVPKMSKTALAKKIFEIILDKIL